MKVNIREQIPKYLGEVKLLTTRCCILEVEKLGAAVFGAAVILKQFTVHNCGHTGAEPRPAAKCLKEMVAQNPGRRYLLATQDPALREKARRLPGVPILYLHRSAPTLEKPSALSDEVATEAASKRLLLHFLHRISHLIGAAKHCLRLLHISSNYGV